MTVSLPVTLPASPAATKANAGAAAKGGNAAPGRPAEPGAERQDVTDMFAALVAALTQQMQPVAEQPTAGQPVVEQPAAEQPVPTAQAMPAAGEPIIVPTLLATPGDAPDVGAVPVDADTEVAVPVVPAAGTTSVAQEGEATTAGPVDALDGPEVPTPAATTADQPKGNETAAAKRPAWAGSDAREVRPTPPSGTAPAMPAQPAQGTGPAAPAVAAVPVSSTDHDSRPVTGIGVIAPTPTGPAAQVDAPATVAAPPAPAADAHVQIARVVRPLRLGDDGAYELALDLTPAELGRVRIDVELRGSTINLHLRSDNPATRELLQASLEQLRTELEAAGLTAGSLDIGGHGGSDRPDQDHDAAPAFTSAADDPVVADPRDREATTVEDTSDGVNVLA